jgi:hypothetical protein
LLFLRLYIEVAFFLHSTRQRRHGTSTLLVEIRTTNVVLQPELTNKTCSLFIMFLIDVHLHQNTCLKSSIGIFISLPQAGGLPSHCDATEPIKRGSKRFTFLSENLRSHQCSCFTTTIIHQWYSQQHGIWDSYPYGHFQMDRTHNGQLG